MIIVDRQAVRPYTIEPINEKEKPLKLQIGDHCLYNLPSLHLDENYFPNPKQFDPERFSDENKHKIIPGTYIPFGVGPRNCIGKVKDTVAVVPITFPLLKVADLLCWR